MNSHYNLYEDLNLNPSSSCEEIDAELRGRLNQEFANGKTDSDPIIDQLRVSGQILTDPWRRHIYDSELQDANGPQVTIARLRQIARMQQPTAGSAPAVRPTPAPLAGQGAALAGQAAGSGQTACAGAFADKIRAGSQQFSNRSKEFSSSLPNEGFNSRYSPKIRLGFAGAFLAAAIVVFLTRFMKWQAWTLDFGSSSESAASFSGIGWLKIKDSLIEDLVTPEYEDILSKSRALLIFPTLTMLVTVALLVLAAFFLFQNRNPIVAITIGGIVTAWQFIWSLWNVFGNGVPMAKWILLPGVVTGKVDGEARDVLNEAFSTFKGDGVTERTLGFSVHLGFKQGLGPALAAILLLLVIIALAVLFAWPAFEPKVNAARVQQQAPLASSPQAPQSPQNPEVAPQNPNAPQESRWNTLPEADDSASNNQCNRWTQQ